MSHPLVRRFVAWALWRIFDVGDWIAEWAFRRLYAMADPDVTAAMMDEPCEGQDA